MPNNDRERITRLTADVIEKRMMHQNSIDVALLILAKIDKAGYRLIYPEKLTVLSDDKINKAFDNAFETPMEFDHKPTADEIFTIKLRAVAQAQLDTIKEIKGE